MLTTEWIYSDAVQLTGRNITANRSELEGRTMREQHKKWRSNRSEVHKDINKDINSDVNKPRARNKRGLLAFVAPLVFIPSLSMASTTYQQAPVVDVQPIYETVSHRVPVEQCHEERVAHTNHRRQSATGPILGALIGGTLGNAVGHGKKNKQVGAVLGAVLGGSIGADVARRNTHRAGDVRYSTEEVCSTSYEVREEERIAAYRVAYVYDDQTYTTRMHRDPGDSIRVRVRVSPAE